MEDAIRAPLEAICHGLDEAVAATLMGMDGIPIDTVTALETEPDLDLNALLIEYSGLLAQLSHNAQMLAAGPLEEISIRSESVTTIIRPLSDEYFVAVALRSTGLSGRGRYLLRVHGPKLRDALS